MDRILGLGNALTDVSVALKDDDILLKMGLPKGGMTHIDETTFSRINQVLGTLDTTITPGGSVGNACRAMAHLGLSTGFIGKVGHDAFGERYAQSLTSVGVENKLIISSTLPSGVCTSFISSDGERTFADHMAASLDLKAEDLKLEMLKGYEYMFIEGYLVQNHALIEQGAQMAKEAGMKVIMDLASYNIILSDLEFCRYLVEQYVDILFANDEEARALTRKKPEEALKELAEMVEMVVVKVGAEGSWVQKGSYKVHADAVKVEQVVDTTGAGDHFAAGFLYGLLRDASLKRCAEIGALVAAQEIQVVGTQLSDEQWLDIKLRIED